VSGYLPDDDEAGVMAFNDKKWRTVPLPSSLVSTGDGNITAASPSNVWLEIERTSDVADSTPYLLHWTGCPLFLPGSAQAVCRHWSRSVFTGFRGHEKVRQR